MASCSISRYSLSLSFLVYLFVPLLADPIPSFGFQTLSKDSNFESQIGLYGDAKLDDSTGSFIQITESQKSSAGSIMYKKPIKLFDKNSKKKFSFGTYFSFSLSPEAGDGLAFLMLPHNFTSIGYDGTPFGLPKSEIEGFAVEFDTQKDENFGDMNANHVGIDVGSLVSVKAKNVSHVLLNSGEKLQCWIDYEASSKRVEVRLSKSGTKRPLNPLLSYQIDLSENFKNVNEVYMGLTSSNGNSTQICNLYSWSFKLRNVPYWMHSHPLDPEVVSKNTKPVDVVVPDVMHKRSDCIVRVLTALIFGTGCGALGAFIVLAIWTFCARGKPIVPEQVAHVHPLDYDYDKFKVVVLEKEVKDVKK